MIKWLVGLTKGHAGTPLICELSVAEVSLEGLCVLEWLQHLGEDDFPPHFFACVCASVLHLGLAVAKMPAVL